MTKPDKKREEETQKEDKEKTVIDGQEEESQALQKEVSKERLKGPRRSERARGWGWGGAGH